MEYKWSASARYEHALQPSDTRWWAEVWAAGLQTDASRWKAPQQDSSSPRLVAAGLPDPHCSLFLEEGTQNPWLKSYSSALQLSKDSQTVQGIPVTGTRLWTWKSPKYDLRSEHPGWCIQRLWAVKESFWWLWRSKHCYFHFSGLILPGDEAIIYY